MKRIIAILCGLLIVSLTTKAQNITMTEVKSSGEYIWGEGCGSTINKADKEALSVLVSQLSISVETGFEINSEETDYEFHERVQSIVKTYSTAKLNNSQLIVISDEPDAKVIRYIAKRDVAQQYKNRHRKNYQRLQKIRLYLQRRHSSLFRYISRLRAYRTNG